MRFQRRTIDLSGAWHLSGRPENGNNRPAARMDQPVFQCTATVPGNIELELEKSNTIPELFMGCNAQKLRPYEFYEWLYETEFEYDGSLRMPELVFEGIDCFGTVYLNGIELGKTDNAFIAHRFKTEGVLKKGKNQLCVHIGSAAGHLKDYPMLPGARADFEYNAEVLWERKPAHAWGWDIMPRIVIGGLWRGVRLEEVPEHRIDEVFLDTLKIEGNKARLRLSLAVTSPVLFEDFGFEVKVQACCKEHCWEKTFPLWSCRGDFIFEIENPLLWQVRNYGDANLYDVTVRLCRKNGTLLAEEKFRQGIRTIELFRRECCTDSKEPDFQFIVNGEPVRIFGTNHVPLDACHSRDRERYEMFFKHAIDLNCNMIRAWGGNVYEDDEFFDHCDEAGILVWQDFMMGCCLYPDHPLFRENLTREIEYTIRKLRQHPSIALWAGDNECDLVHGWALQLNLDPNANKLTRELLPLLCRMNDPSRPYLASSPFVAERSWERGLAEKRDPMDFSPEQHLWGPRDYFKSDFYTKSLTSFTSETGYHGCNSATSIRKFIPADAVWPQSLDWTYHASAPFLPADLFAYRIPLMSKQICEFFGSCPERLEDFCRASQIVQAEAEKYLIELNKQRRKRSGILWWNLIDGWPQFSDAVMDYYAEKKLAWYYIQVVQNPLLGSISEPDSWHRSIFFSNDTAEDAEGTFTLSDALTNEVIRQGSFKVAARSITDALSYEVCTTEKKLLLLRWECKDGRKGVNHMLTGYPEFDYNWYSTVILPALARIYGTFNADTIGK